MIRPYDRRATKGRRRRAARRERRALAALREATGMAAWIIARVELDRLLREAHEEFFRLMTAGREHELITTPMRGSPP